MSCRIIEGAQRTCRVRKECAQDPGGAWTCGIMSRGFAMPSDPSVPPDATIEAFKKDVDRTLLRENLRLTPEQRILKLQDFVSFAIELREKRRAVRP